MLSELHSLDLKLCTIVAPQLSSGWRHNYLERHAGQANEKSMYSLMSMSNTLPLHGTAVVLVYKAILSRLMTLECQ
jgi:hypothetical protein